MSKTSLDGKSAARKAFVLIGAVQALEKTIKEEKDFGTVWAWDSIAGIDEVLAFLRQADIFDNLSTEDGDITVSLEESKQSLISVAPKISEVLPLLEGFLKSQWPTLEENANPDLSALHFESEDAKATAAEKIFTASANAGCSVSFKLNQFCFVFQEGGTVLHFGNL